MEKLDVSIKKINFKKAIILYLIFILTVGIAYGAFIGYQFREKLSTIYKANKIEDNFENGSKDTVEIKEDLTSLAKNSSDIVDILLLDSSNRILFSAKNSNLASGETFILKNDMRRGNDYLYVESLPDNQFSLLEDRGSIANLALKNLTDLKDRHGDDYFYESDLIDKTIYTISYVLNRQSGEKIYIISDINPVPYSELYFKIAAVIAMLFFMGYWLLVTFWVYQNAIKSKLNPLLWGMIVLCTNLAGLFVYLIYKSMNLSCFKCGALQNRDNLYCTSCGTKIGSTCPSCGTMISEKFSYCRNCGNKVSEEE